MFNNNSQYPYYNNIQAFTGFRITPVARIEEASSVFPDLQGNPLFFFDQARNEIYVKQRKVQTGEVELLRYTMSSEPIKASNVQSNSTNLEKEIDFIKRQLARLDETLGIKVKKEVKEDDK